MINELVQGVFEGAGENLLGKVNGNEYALGVCRTFMSCHYPSWQNIVSEHIKIIRKRTISHCFCVIVYVLYIVISNIYL